MWNRVKQGHWVLKLPISLITVDKPVPRVPSRCTIIGRFLVGIPGCMASPVVVMGRAVGRMQSLDMSRGWSSEELDDKDDIC